jgi:hypothetical protein
MIVVVGESHPDPADLGLLRWLGIGGVGGRYSYRVMKSRSGNIWRLHAPLDKTAAVLWSALGVPKAWVSLDETRVPHRGSSQWV